MKNIKVIVFIALILVAVAVYGYVVWASESKPNAWNDCWLAYVLPEDTNVILRPLDKDPPKLRFIATGEVAADPHKASQDPRQMPFDIHGGGEMLFVGGKLLLEKGRMVYLLGGDVNAGRVLFRVPQDQATVVILDEGIKPDENRKLKAGPLGTVLFDTTPLPVTLSSAASVHPYTVSNDFTDIVRSERLPSAIPANTLKVRIDKPGLDVRAALAALRACIQTSQSEKPQTVAIEKVTNAGNDSSGTTELILALPPKLRPLVFDRGWVAIMLADGSFVGQDDFSLVGFLPALLLAFLAGIVGHLLVRYGVLTAQGSWFEWFIGRDQQPSLSLFQIYLWTWVVLLGCIYVFALTGEPLAITWQVLALVGIAGTGSIAARFVSVAQNRNPLPQDKDGGRFGALFKTDGAFDIYKLQMFLFTVFAAVFVVARIIVDRAFPALDENLLLLLGISNGIYVGSKFASGESENLFQVADRADINLRLLKEAKNNVEGEVVGLQSKIDRIEELKKRIADLDVQIAGAQSPQKEQLQNRKTQLDSEKQSLETEKPLLIARKSAAEKKVAELDVKIADATKARSDAIAKLSAH